MKQKIIIDIRGDIAPDAALLCVSEALFERPEGPFFCVFPRVNVCVERICRKDTESVRYLVWQGNEVSE